MKIYTENHCDIKKLMLMKKNILERTVSMSAGLTVKFFDNVSCLIHTLTRRLDMSRMLVAIHLAKQALVHCGDASVQVFSPDGLSVSASLV